MVPRNRSIIEGCWRVGSGRIRVDQTRYVRVWKPPDPIRPDPWGFENLLTREVGDPPMNLLIVLSYYHAAHESCIPLRLAWGIPYLVYAYIIRLHASHPGWVRRGRPQNSMFLYYKIKNKNNNQNENKNKKHELWDRGTSMLIFPSCVWCHCCSGHTADPSIARGLYY